MPFLGSGQYVGCGRFVAAKAVGRVIRSKGICQQVGKPFGFTSGRGRQLSSEQRIDLSPQPDIDCIFLQTYIAIVVRSGNQVFLSCGMLLTCLLSRLWLREREYPRC